MFSTKPICNPLDVKCRNESKLFFLQNICFSKCGLYYVFTFVFRVFIGIKKLLGMLDMARQTEQKYRVAKFLTRLEDEGGLEMSSGH